MLFNRGRIVRSRFIFIILFVFCELLPVYFINFVLYKPKVDGKDEQVGLTWTLFFQLEEELSGVVEVVGMVSNKGALMATTYNILQQDKGVAFGKFHNMTDE